MNMGRSIQQNRRTVPPRSGIGFNQVLQALPMLTRCAPMNPGNWASVTAIDVDDAAFGDRRRNAAASSTILDGRGLPQVNRVIG
jgi:hypothetical protein